MTSTPIASPASAAAERAERALAAGLAILVGAFLIFGAALANPSAIHNAAHDARHAFAFPCH